MGSASSQPQTNLDPQTNLAGENFPAIEGEREEAEKFAAVVIDISARRLGKAAKRTTEAAKGWKEGRSLPSTWSILNMAMTIPKVRGYLLHKLGAGGLTHFNSPQAMTAVVQIIATMTPEERNALLALLQGQPNAR